MVKSNIFEECFIESKTLVMDIIDIVTRKMFGSERGTGTIGYEITLYIKKNYI